MYLIQLSAEYDRISPPEAVGSRGLFSGAGGAGTPVGALLALSGTSLLMQHAVSNASIMLCLFCCLLLGNILLFAVPAVPSSPKPDEKSEHFSETTAETQPVSFWAIPQLWMASPQLRLLMCCTSASGYANAFMSGSFTKDIVGPSLGSAWIGYVLATRNLLGLLSGVLLGRLSDHTPGRYPCYLIALSCEGVMSWSIATGVWKTIASSDSEQRAVLFVLAGFMGVGNMGSCEFLSVAKPEVSN